MVEQPTSEPEPSPLPASGSHASPDVRDADGTTLHTDLLGDLMVPGGGGREAELKALSQRAAVYASRARGDGTRGSTPPPGAATSLGAIRWAASRSPATPDRWPCTPPTVPTPAWP